MVAIIEHRGRQVYVIIKTQAYHTRGDNRKQDKIRSRKQNEL